MNKVKLFSMALLYLGALMTTSAQTVDEIVTKHIEAIGGKDNWAKIKSLRTESTMKSNGTEIKFVITQIDKKAMRVDMTITGMKGYTILTNKEGWEFMPFQGQTKPEPLTADDVKTEQDGLQIQDEFITYKELGKKLDYLGKDDVDGTECLKLKMIDKEGKEVTFYIDPANYYTIKQVEKIKADGKEMEIATMYGNYKKTEIGILYPMSITKEGEGMEITKIEINPIIDEASFKAPM
jgi:hypothetical protein